MKQKNFGFDLKTMQPMTYRLLIIKKHPFLELDVKVILVPTTGIEPATY